MAALPWEFLHGRDGLPFLAAQSDVTLVRDHSPAQRERLPRTRGRLKVLVAWACPADLPPLDEEAICEEVAHIRSAGKPPGKRRRFLARRPVEVRVLAHAGPDAFEQEVRKGVDLIHFTGHGGLVEESGALYFEDEDGDAVSMSAQELVSLLNEVQDGKARAPRLVVLNACHTADAGEVEGMVGLSAALVDRARLPAVVGMGYAIAADSAAVFSQAFYDQLVQYGQVDYAVARGRRALFNKIGPGHRDWGVPRLYMRTPSGIVFDWM
jgi:hypothetical protein